LNELLNQIQNRNNNQFPTRHGEQLPRTGANEQSAHGSGVHDLIYPVTFTPIGPANTEEIGIFVSNYSF
jgi:hypothetical protein